MKAYVMRVGDGLALPLPTNLAAALGLRPGSALEIHGPGPDGSLRYVPASESESETKPAAETARTGTNIASREFPSPTDVAKAVSSNRPPAEPRPAPPENASELESFVYRHEALLREVGS